MLAVALHQVEAAQVAVRRDGLAEGDGVSAVRRRGGGGVNEAGEAVVLRRADKGAGDAACRVRGDDAALRPCDPPGFIFILRRHNGGPQL